AVARDRRATLCRGCRAAALRAERAADARLIGAIVTSASVVRSRRPLDVRWVLSTAFIIMGTLFVLWSMSVRIPAPGQRPMDAEIVWEHSKLIGAGEPPYSPWPDFGPHYMTEAAPYPVGRTPYPPFLTVALKPLLPIGDL